MEESSRSSLPASSEPPGSRPLELGRDAAAAAPRISEFALATSRSRRRCCSMPSVISVALRSSASFLAVTGKF